MPACVAVGCKNRTEKTRMFRFPADNVRRQQWILNLRRESWTPTKSSYLCEKHFEDSQFEANRADNWRKLKPNAVPTLFNIITPPAVAINVSNVTTTAKQNAENIIAEPNTNPIAEKDIVDECTMLKRENEHLQEQLKAVLAAEKCTKDENKALHQQLENLNTALQKFLNNEQIEMLRHGRLTHWPNEEIIKALKLKFALSVNGYNYLRSTGYPLPAYSTLMRRVQDFKVNFEILDDACEKF